MWGLFAVRVAIHLGAPVCSFGSPTRRMSPCLAPPPGRWRLTLLFYRGGTLAVRGSVAVYLCRSLACTAAPLLRRSNSAALESSTICHWCALGLNTEPSWRPGLCRIKSRTYRATYCPVGLATLVREPTPLPLRIHRTWLPLPWVNGMADNVSEPARARGRIWVRCGVGAAI